MATVTSVRIYRPRAVIGDLGHFRVFLDGSDVGELSAGQVRTFELTPGEHQIRLTQFVIRRGSFVFTVREGEGLELACSRLAAFGLFGIHVATPKESEKIHKVGSTRAQRPARDLGQSQGGTS